MLRSVLPSPKRCASVVSVAGGIFSHLCDLWAGDSCARSARATWCPSPRSLAHTSSRIPARIGGKTQCAAVDRPTARAVWPAVAGGHFSVATGRARRRRWPEWPGCVRRFAFASQTPVTASQRHDRKRVSTSASVAACLRASSRARFSTPCDRAVSPLVWVSVTIRSSAASAVAVHRAASAGTWSAASRSPSSLIKPRDFDKHLLTQRRQLFAVGSSLTSVFSVACASARSPFAAPSRAVAFAGSTRCSISSVVSRCRLSRRRSAPIRRASPRCITACSGVLSCKKLAQCAVNRQLFRRTLRQVEQPSIVHRRRRQVPMVRTQRCQPTV